ncbi:MAG: 5-formyltetrahydrofolate cyclo-ligase [Ruminococcaceae bacterium]|nr:5-formyltetrahydrofolate cyclo-ligase [Oscillospiraceae bacterium]
MHPIDIRKYKQELRLKCRERRTKMIAEEKAKLDKSIAENVRRLKEYRPAQTILIYMSTPIEVDTKEIIKNAWDDGKKVAIPRCTPGSRDMEFHYIDSFDCVSPGTFSVLEPDPALPVVTDFSGCLMIVPGMQFDMRGFRIGYGKGYYDRYMVRFKGISAGICYSDELKPFMYHGRYDRQVDIVVTDKRIKTCKTR